MVADAYESAALSQILQEVMNYFSRIKPVLNKLTELNVYDSLKVVRAYMQALADGNTCRAQISGVNNSRISSVEIWFADFLIANIIKYSDDVPSCKSLRDANTRHYICDKIEELHREVSRQCMRGETLIWLSSYMFNQFKILARDNELRALYRYYSLYKTSKIRAYAEGIMGMPLDAYFKMAFFVAMTMSGNDKFYIQANYFLPEKKRLDGTTEATLEYVLSQISKPLPELKRLCKDYCSYDEEKIFSVFSDAPHVKYPLIKDKGGYFCTIPRYITAALLDGLYYRLDIPNSGDPDITKEFSENMEDYLGLIFSHFLNGSKVDYQQEITYDVGKRKTQRTSDWILWDEGDICFMDCKTKRISVKGKQAVTVDDDTINRVVRNKPYSSTRKKKEIDEAIPEGLTKDLINIGLGVGKVFVSYDDYKAGNVTGFPYKEGHKFYAVIVTLEDNLSNTPGYKDRILKVAQSYRDAKSDHSEQIDDSSVIMLTVRNIEECACIIAKEGIGFYLENHKDNQLMAQKYVNDKFLIDRCNKELIHPFLEEIKECYGD